MSMCMASERYRSSVCVLVLVHVNVDVVSDHVVVCALRVLLWFGLSVFFSGGVYCSLVHLLPILLLLSLVSFYLRNISLSFSIRFGMNV